MKKILLTFFLLLSIGLLGYLGAFVLQGNLAAVISSLVAEFTNNARTDNKVTPLKNNDLLTKAAEAKAADMAKNGYFSHVSPDGKKPWYWLDKAGYNYQYAGENLAVNFGESRELVTAWMNSPSHRANILNPNFTDIGIGMATGTYQGRPATFVVQFFASKGR